MFYVCVCVLVLACIRMSCGRHVNLNETKRIQISLFESCIASVTATVDVGDDDDDDDNVIWNGAKTYAIHTNVHRQMNACQFCSSFFRSTFSPIPLCHCFISHSS